MTDNIVWGRPIETHGQPLRWVGRGTETAQYQAKNVLPANWVDTEFNGWSDLSWSLVEAIRLPADHCAYRALDAGFEPWGGGENAPDDWDGGPVLQRGGFVEAAGTLLKSQWWVGDKGNPVPMDIDIIGYRKRGQTVPQPDDGEYVRVKRMTEREARAVFLGRQKGTTNQDHFVNCLASLGLLEPTPLDRFMAAHPDADRATAEAALAWSADNAS